MRVLRELLVGRGGNIALLTSLMLVPTILVMGGTLDLLRYTSASTRMQNALEAGALAAASLTSTLPTEEIIEQYIQANIPDGEMRDNLVVSAPEPVIEYNQRIVTIEARTTMEPFFLQLIGVSEVPISVTTVAAQSSTSVEIAAVLDISSSMSGNRLTNLKTAAEQFVIEIFEDDETGRTSMSLIPFGGTVNVGDLFDDYAVPLATATVNPSEAEYNIGSAVGGEEFRFTEGLGCLEHREEDFNKGLIPAHSRGQVPHFWRWWNFNPWCPNAASAVLLNTNDQDALIDHIRGMDLSDGTGMDIGAMWGAKVMNPEWVGRLGGDFNDRPSPYEEETLKVVIIMTDGGITQQNRPQDYAYYNTHTNVSNNLLPTQMSRVKGNNGNMQTVVTKGASGDSSTADTAVGYFKRVCDELHDDGVLVYTIGFQISSGSLPDDMLQYCASNPSYYYLVESLDIAAAFSSIASSVNALRVVG